MSEHPVQEDKKSTTAIVVVIYRCGAERWTAYRGDERVIVVDNTPGRDLALTGERLDYIPLRENTGIAAAQNAGLRRAAQRGCSHIVFFDQDSLPPEGYAARMVEQYRGIDRALGGRLFILGPTVVNGRTDREYRSAIHRDADASAEGFVPRRDVISSGCCVSADKVGAVGGLDERLFIDGVDFEWCWRAASLGYVNGITRRVSLTHFVGASDFTCLGQQVIISAPFRYFYQGRNYLYLLPRRYVPLQWKVNDLLKRTFHMAVIPFRVKGWTAIYANLIKGTLAGLGLPLKPNLKKA